MTPIPFQPITADAFDIIARFHLLCDNHVSDYSLANLYGWQESFNTQYAVVDNHLVIRFINAGGAWYMRPLAPQKGMCAETLDVVEQLRRDAFLSGHDFCIYGLLEQEATMLQERHATTMQTQPMRNNAGYLYQRQRLATLAGRHLQAKRNHVNKFRSLYPSYDYRPLTANLCDECIAFATQWAGRHIETFPDQTESAAGELRAIRRTLSMIDRLPLIGGTLWVDGSMIAFTYGCHISDDTLDVCVEKADTNYEGAYTMINQLFAQHVPEQYVYLNREEDLGVEGLRKAKLSYHPEEILVRYLCTESLPYPADEIAQTKTMWQKTFGDSRMFVDLYFDHMHDSRRAIACIDGTQTVASTQLPVYELDYYGQLTPVAYISGVMVDERWRHHGIGRRMMSTVHALSAHLGDTFALLIPASRDISRWYASMDYAEAGRCTAATEAVVGLPLAKYNELTAVHPCRLLHSADDYATAQADIAQEGLPNDRTDRTVMLRIIDMLQALRLYAQRHETLQTTIYVNGDSDVPTNNGYYSIRLGHVQRLLSPDDSAVPMTPADVTAMLFGEHELVCSLMMER